MPLVILRPKYAGLQTVAGRNNATLTEPASGQENCLKTRRIPQVGCTQCLVDGQVAFWLSKIFTDANALR
jgi:hypothetical protein